MNRNKRIIIIGKSGTGKSKTCFDLAKKYVGTVIYLSDCCLAENYYQKFGALNNFEVHQLSKTIRLQDGKKYFFVPANNNHIGNMIPLLGLDKNNDFTQNLHGKSLLIIDDGLWERCADKTLLLWKLSYSSMDIVITVSDWNELLGDDEISGRMKKDIGRKWNIIELGINQ